MFERFTESARRALFFAREEATKLGSTSIDVSHLALGLIRRNEGLAFSSSRLPASNPRLIMARHGVALTASSGTR